MKIIRQGNLNCWFGLFGICFAALGFLYGLYWNALFEILLQKFLSLRPDSFIYKFWKTTPVNINVDFYIFNWTNSEDFYKQGVRPRFEQLGPYRFIEKSDKFDIIWHPENASVSYKKRSYYYFDAENSQGKLSDKVITLNLISVSAAAKINKWDYFRRKIATLALNMHPDSAVLTTTVDKMLFKGNSDILMNVAKTMPYLVNEIMPFDKFGYCYQRNGSADFWGKVNIFTGTDDFAKIGKIHTWNYAERNGVFKSDCGMLTGTPGELQQPNLKVNDSITYFVSDFCRSLTLDYVDQSKINGIPYFKFAGGLRTVENGTIYPENKCYCLNEECVPSGLMSIGSCWFNTPLFISYPHFYQADPVYLNAVEGLKPNKDLHELYVLLEPRTGFTLDIKARLQINIFVEPIPSFRLFKNAPRAFFPIFWIDENVEVPDNITYLLKFVPIILKSGHIIAALVTLVGIAIVTCHLRTKFSKAGNFIKHMAERREEENVFVKTSVECPLLNDKLKAQPIGDDKMDTVSGISVSSSTAAFLNKDPSLSINESESSLSRNE